MAFSARASAAAALLLAAPALAQSAPPTGLSVCDDYLAAFLVCLAQRDEGEASARHTGKIAAMAKEIRDDLEDPATKPLYENVCAVGLSVARNITARGGCGAGAPK